MEQQFGEVIDIILQHKGRASRAVITNCYTQRGMLVDMYQPN